MSLDSLSKRALMALELPESLEEPWGRIGPSTAFNDFQDSDVLGCLLEFVTTTGSLDRVEDTRCHQRLQNLEEEPLRHTTASAILWEGSTEYFPSLSGFCIAI